MRWFEKQRIEWIGLKLQKDGHIQRKDLMGQFQISIPQASNDLRTYKTLRKKWMFPAIKYNASSKRYEVQP